MATDIEELKDKKTAAPTTFPAMLERFKTEIARALPSHLSGDRMARIALTAFRRTPKLGQCDPRSVFAAVIQASQLGLEPDTLGRAYLVPYGRECQFIPGWKGLVDLMNRSGMGSVHTGVIYRDQKYVFRDGSKRSLDILNETTMDAPNDITHSYAVGWIKGVENPLIELWRVEKIVKHRDRYNKVGKSHYSFSNWEMYARKVPLLQVLKYMPCSAELAAAITLNDAAEVNRQNLTVTDAIEGTWAPVPDDDQGEQTDGAQNTDSQAGGAGEQPAGKRGRRAAANAGGAPAGGAGATQGENNPPAQGTGGHGQVTLPECMAWVKKGDYDEALDLARSLTDIDRQAVNAAIEQHKADNARRGGSME